MANIPDYICSSCGKSTNRDNLTVKKAVFLEMGMGARTLRSRVVGWYCDSCLESDQDYKREPFEKKGANKGDRQWLSTG